MPASHLLVIGASRGLGREFVRQDRAAAGPVTATARNAGGPARLAALGVRPVPLDLLDASSALAW